MNRILVPALAALSLAACLGDDPVSVDRIECDPLLRQVTGVTGDTISGTGGLRYLDRKVGTGDPVAAGRQAEVHYTLSLTDQQVLESSCVSARTFRYGTGTSQVIPGFDQGVIGMRPGGVRRVIVPPALAYGNTPGHELQEDTLVFDIELVAVR